MKQFRYNVVMLMVPVLMVLAPGAASAQSMMNTQSTSTSEASSTTADEQKGQDIYNQLQNKQTTCSNLNDDDFDVLGDFFMGRMMGSSHAAMNQYMVDNLGANGEKQVHVAMGKRLSGCDANASYPSSVNNYSSLSWMNGMGMMSNGMMNDFGHSGWSWTSVLLGVLLVISVVWNIVMWQDQSKIKGTKGSDKKQS